MLLHYTQVRTHLGNGGVVALVQQALQPVAGGLPVHGDQLRLAAAILLVRLVIQIHGQRIIHIILLIIAPSFFAGGRFWLTYLEVPKQKSYSRELYYLRGCYNQTFPYAENDPREQDEIFISSISKIWGISKEAAVCLARPDNSDREHIQTQFYDNFTQQYLLMYVLLLHQKYVLYLFLTSIGAGMYDNLERLEDYQQRLIQFEADFVFSRVTEVVQHQDVYDRMVKIFALKEIFEDVHGPLVALGEMRKEAAENEQKSRMRS